MSQDFYELLGVQKGADASEIKRAYRKLAMQYHPDKNPGDEAAEKKFKEINAAYDILKDEQKRAAYDQYGHAAFEQGAGQGGPFGGFDFGGAGGGFSDIFEDIFSSFTGGAAGGGRGRAQVNNRGADLRYNLAISLEDAYFGEKTTITVPSNVVCDSCDGTGSESGSGTKTCPTCNGMGRVQVRQGFIAMERTCSTCDGLGQIVEDPCRKCRGQGRVQKTRTLNVTIPKGVEEGTRIRLSGEGEAGLRGGPAGDLYLFIHVEQHELFERDGHDLHLQVPVPLTTAILGGEVEVPTMSGSRANVKIPAATQQGDVFRLRDKGMGVMGSSGRHGDLYIHAALEVPSKLSKKQKKLLEELESELASSKQPETENFAKKQKRFLERVKGR